MPGNWTPVSVKDSPSTRVVDSQAIAAEVAPSALPSVEMFELESPRRSLDDLIVSQATRLQIEMLISKIKHQHTLYEVWDLKRVDPYGGRTAINLYGPPGTGKSFCAEAIARTLGKPILRVNYAELESKYVGETPKNIRAAFAKARESDSVLFFDEADSILGKRLTNVTQSADHGVNVSRSMMLLELDRFSGVVIFATNLAKNYDGAFVRRIVGHVEMPLPDRGCRERLWDLHLPDRLPKDPGVNAEQLADMTEGFSGGDILNCVIQAASVAVQRTSEAQLVRMDDLTTAIEAVNKAKVEIGDGNRSLKVMESTIPIEEAPEEVQAKVRAMQEPLDD